MCVCVTLLLIPEMENLLQGTLNKSRCLWDIRRTGLFLLKVRQELGSWWTSGNKGCKTLITESFWKKKKNACKVEKFNMT